MEQEQEEMQDLEVTEEQEGNNIEKRVKEEKEFWNRKINTFRVKGTYLSKESSIIIINNAEVKKLLVEHCKKIGRTQTNFVIEAILTLIRDNSVDGTTSEAETPEEIIRQERTKSNVFAEAIFNLIRNDMEKGTISQRVEEEEREDIEKNARRAWGNTIYRQYISGVDKKEICDILSKYYSKGSLKSETKEVIDILQDLQDN